jgi:hypothetical protein
MPNCANSMNEARVANFVTDAVSIGSEGKMAGLSEARVPYSYSGLLWRVAFR